MTGLSVDLSGMRAPYRGLNEKFDVDDLVSKEPYGQFKAWFEEVCNTDGVMEPNAMSLATATKDGKPSVRMVLMKGYDKNGFIFFTNYGSRKAKELAENPQATLMFYWEQLKRMVRIEGTVEKLSEEISTEYFHSRPKDSQIGAVISRQSQPIQSRKILEDRNEEYTKKFAEKEVPKPDFWGGYLVKPDLFEFWQGQTSRIHDRIVFCRPGPHDDPEFTHQGTDGWVFSRLQP